ncbi:MAG TPA: beta-ketoacyl-ACP synthase II [Verrucomicrobiota bacterium]|nr:beta-ketoacyl-ACP synthase II [Verrucomicrobiota bacterium]
MSSWSDRRVVVTGIGCASSLGHDPVTLWNNIVNGRSGIGRITAFDASKFDCQIAAQIGDLDPSPAFPSPKEVRRTDRFSHFGVYAGWGALKDSGLDLEKVNRDEIGVFLGSGIGGLQTTEEQHTVLLNKGPSRISPFMIPMLILNMASGLFSLYYKLRGPNFATCSACATATHAIGEAWATIKRGDAVVMFAGGTEATVVPLGISGFAAMKAMSTRNDEPQKACRPFDRDRDGFVMGEGAAVVALEELEHAKKRGARIYCEVAGYGNTADASHMTAPDPEGEGAARAMRMALRHAELRPDQMDYVNCHATSTPVGDLCEVRMIKHVFGEHAYRLAASATKSMTGHMLGAAGAIEMAICCKAIEAQVAPPTINLDNPDPEADLNLVAHTAQERKIEVFANNSFGFGGHNAIIVGRRFLG